MKKRTGLVIVSIIALALVSTSALAVYAAGQNAQKSTQSSASKTAVVETKPSLPTANELLKLVNEERAKVGVAPLQLDTRLNTSAQRKADDEAKYNYFGHISPNDNKHGYQYIDDVNIACKSDSENLYWGNGNLATPESAVDWWLQSSAHKKAMLDGSYSLTGFGIGLMPDKKTVTVVEHFCQT